MLFDMDPSKAVPAAIIIRLKPYRPVLCLDAPEKPKVKMNFPGLGASLSRPQAPLRYDPTGTAALVLALYWQHLN